MKKSKKGKKRRLAAVLTLCTALAAIPAQSFAGGSVSMSSEGVYQVHCSGLTAGKEYSVMVVRGTLADYSLNDSSVVYFTQLHANSTSGEATIRIGKSETAVVLLSGEISGATSPEVIGLIENGALSEHRYTVTEKKNTCLEQGYRTYTCSHCGDQIIRDVTAPKGHDYQISSRVYATEASDGYIEYKCGICGDTYREILLKESAWNCPFTDVSRNEWFYESVKYAYKNSLFNGVTENTFEPDSEMTRAMLVTVLYRMEGKPSVNANAHSFTDVSAGSWYEKGVAWASSKGVVNGIGDGLFAPDDNVTREQMAAILCRYAALKGCSTADQADLSSFKDSGMVSDWAKKSLSWACAAGLISGSATEQGLLLDPEGNATRAQVATVLMRYLRNVL